MSHAGATQNGQEHAGKKKLQLVVVSLVGKWNHPFEPEETVQAVINQSVDHFKPKLADGSYQLERKSDKTVLDPSRTLASYGLNDKEDLLLTPLEDGGGM